MILKEPSILVGQNDVIKLDYTKLIAQSINDSTIQIINKEIMEVILFIMIKYIIF